MMKRYSHLLPFFLCAILTAMILLSAGCTNSSRAQSFSSLPQASQIHHIALLLPTSGPLAPYGTAIRHGFFAAYYDQKNRSGTAPTITVFNTTGKNIRDVYQTAVTQGADFVVGPLDKTDVLTLANASTLTVPILALNTIPADNNNLVNNKPFYEFALSPTDEAQQAAEKAFQDHHRNIIILAPNNAWGQRLAIAFTNQWKNLGGTIIATEYYGDITSLSKNIQDVLQISNAYNNEKKLKKLLNSDMRFIPDRRQDFDSVFLIATPVMGRQIKPLLNFYFAQQIPVYATSEIYSGIPNAARDSDLNDIAFCDMPWILTPNQLQPSYLQSIQQTTQALWPDNNNRLATFYAMGVDAFYLSMQLHQLQSHPQLGMPAATGTLYLTAQHHIYRQLTWAQFQNGTPVLVQ